jgi:signal transduction histidine kinase
MVSEWARRYGGCAAATSGLNRDPVEGFPWFRLRPGSLTMVGVGPAVASLSVNAGTEPASRRRSAALASVIAAVGGVACALSAFSHPLAGLPVSPLDEAIHVAVPAAYIGAGVVALLRRPGNATGLLMAAVGFLWLVWDLIWIPAALPFTIASGWHSMYQAALAHLGLAFPTGRLPGRLERIAVIGIYTWGIASNVVSMLFYDPQQEGCAWCSNNLLLIYHDPGIESIINTSQNCFSIVLIGGAVVLIVRHWRRATRAARHVMSPVLWAVWPTVAYLVTYSVSNFVTLPAAWQRPATQWLPAVLIVMPLGFLVGLLRTRLAYAQVGALLPELSGPLPPGRVRAALAATLHDPDLELLYWSPTSDGYVDIDGQRREPEPGPGRAVAPIAGESGPLAVMMVDETVLQEPALLQAAGAMARLALENERLQAEVRSQLVQLRSTTARLVEAGQDARRRIERDLHDGAQQRLLALSMTLGQARARAAGSADSQIQAFLETAAIDLQHAITELRELARGIHPMLLTQEGLGSALRALAERAPLPVLVSTFADRFPDTVEATVYFFPTEAVTNAGRHSRASVVKIDITVEDDELIVRARDDGVGGVDAAPPGGSGLVRLRDRVIAVGGRMTVSSPAGGGTTLMARLPCV